MAVRRMLHAQIIKSDSFLSMPFSAQMLYIQITMEADDDGFYNGPEQLRRRIGAKKQDLETLCDRRFLLRFGDVVVVKHWRMANSLKNDRIKPLTYANIAERLYIKENRAYTDHPVEGAETLLSFRKHLRDKRNPVGIPVEEKGKEEKRNEMKRNESNLTEAKPGEAQGMLVSIPPSIE